MTETELTLDELRRAIAEALGWRIDVLAPGEPDSNGFILWALLYKPDGTLLTAFHEPAAPYSV